MSSRCQFCRRWWPRKAIAMTTLTNRESSWCQLCRRRWPQDIKSHHDAKFVVAGGPRSVAISTSVATSQHNISRSILVCLSVCSRLQANILPMYSCKKCNSYTGYFNSSIGFEQGYISFIGDIHLPL